MTDPYIPLCIPYLGGNEWAYVKECLDTNWISSAGAFVGRFEAMAAGALGSGNAVATVSGTAALHVSLMLAGVKPGDEVVVSDLTFIAPANAVRYLGAWPVFVDAEPSHWQMDPQKLRDFLRKDCSYVDGRLRNKHTGRPVTAILPVHILGHPCDMEPILGEAAAFGLPVVEDATEGLGVLYKGKPVGTFGLIACLSFNGNKIVTTGGGGMIVTNDGQLAEKARYLTTQAKDNAVEYIHEEVGFNYRLTNLQAAMGVAQMERLQELVARKRATAGAYHEAFADVPGIRCPEEPEGAFSTFWLYTILVDGRKTAVDSRELMRHLDASAIQTRPLWQPMHLSPAHKGSYATDCSVAERLNREALSLPSSAGLSEGDRKRVVETLIEGLREGRT